CGHLLANGNAVTLRLAVWNGIEVGGIVPVENRLLVWGQAEGRLQTGVAAVGTTDERGVRRGCDGRCGRRLTQGVEDDGVRLVAALDCDCRFIDRGADETHVSGPMCWKPSPV